MLANDQSSSPVAFDAPSLAVTPTLAGPSGRRGASLRDVVLRTMREAGKPLSAYGLIELLAPQFGRRLFPPTVYRALDYLITQRLVVRIESRHSYWAIPPGQATLASVLCICDHCGVAEWVASPSCERATDQEAASLGFRVERRVIELLGTCARCLSVDVPSTHQSDG